MEIYIKSIPHKEMPFPDCGEGGIGDWRDDEKGVTQIRVSKVGVDIYEKLIAIHELVENTLIKLTGIDPEWYDAYCTENKIDCATDGPIAKQHETAEICERIVAQAAGVNWEDYSNYITWFMKNKVGE